MLVAVVLLISPLTITAQTNTIGKLYTKPITLVPLEDGLGVRGVEQAEILAAKLRVLDMIMLTPTPQACLLSNIIASTNEQHQLSKIDSKLLELDHREDKRKAAKRGAVVASVIWVSVGAALIWGFTQMKKSL